MQNARDFIKELNLKIKAEKKGSLMLLNSAETKITEGLSSGSLNLNMALSGNPSVGYARGRIVEIYGLEQSGKTTLVLHAIAEAQKLGWPAVFIDAEHALDPIYANNIGVDFYALGFNQPYCGEEALTLVERVIREGCPLVIVDSVAALTPRAEIEGEMGAAHMGLQARLMSQAMRKLVGIVKKANAILIFINQIRLKVGVLFGNPETTPGGKALKFYSSYRLEVRAPRGGAKTEKSLDENATIETGINANVKVVKNKVFPPFRRAVVPIRYGIGIDKVEDLVDYLFKAGKFVIPKGAKTKTVKFLFDKKYYSKNVLKALMKKDPSVYEDIMKGVLK